MHKIHLVIRLFLLLILVLRQIGNVYAGQGISAIIIADANLRSGPSATARIITPMMRDTKVLLGDSDDGWVQVEVPSLAESGWVHGSLVRPITDSKSVQQSKKKIIEPEQQKIKKAELLQKHKTEASAESIAVIDIQQVIDQSIRGREARNRFEKMRQSPETEQVAQIEKEMISHIITEIRSVVEQYARKKGYTQVLNTNSGSVFYTDPSFDITNDIIREYDQYIPQQQNKP